MKNVPLPERPRERCLRHGSDTLSLRECLALLLTPGPAGLGAMGLAEQLLRSADDALSERAFFLLLESRGDPLPAARGLGDARRARLLATFEIARRYHAFRVESLSRASEFSRDHEGHAFRNRLRQAALERVPAERKADAREWLGFVPHFGTNTPGPFCLVERGARTHVNTEPAELFARILALRPRGIWLFHNHPSGRLEPSDDDRLLTRRVAQVCRQLGLDCLGHGIVTPGGSTHWIPPSSFLD